MRILTYDLNQEKSKQDYEGFYSVINTYAYAKLSESSYALDTTDSPKRIYRRLDPYIDNNDHVLILTLNKPWYGRHNEKVIDWLEERLPNNFFA